MDSSWQPPSSVKFMADENQSGVEVYDNYGEADNPAYVHDEDETYSPSYDNIAEAARRPTPAASQPYQETEDEENGDAEMYHNVRRKQTPYEGGQIEIKYDNPRKQTPYQDGQIEIHNDMPRKQTPYVETAPSLEDEDKSSVRSDSRSNNSEFDDDDDEFDDDNDDDNDTKSEDDYEQLKRAPVESDQPYDTRPPQRSGTAKYAREQAYDRRPKESRVSMQTDSAHEQSRFFQFDPEPTVRFQPDSKDSVREVNEDRDNRVTRWDVFRAYEFEEEDRAVAYRGTGKNFLKALCFFFTFTFFLLGATVTKVTVLIAASNIRNTTVDGDSETDFQVPWIWCIFLILITPQIFTFIRCAWMISFKHKKSFTGKTLCLVLTVETLHTMGLTLLAFQVLPKLQSALHGAALLCGAGIVPALLLLFKYPKGTGAIWCTKYFLNLVAIGFQLSALFVWPILQISIDNLGANLVWSIPLSLFLLSIGWWENFIHEDSKLGPLIDILRSYKKNIRQSRTKLYLVCSLWKIIVIFIFMMVWTAIDIDIGDLFDFSFQDADACIAGDFSMGPVLIWVICSCAGLLTYMCARTAAKVLLQYCYLIPLNITTPMVFGLLILICEVWGDEGCNLHCYSSLSDVFGQQLLWMAALWWLSQCWIGSYVWKRPPLRLMKTDKLFIRPLYDNITIEQWLYYNYNRGHGFDRLPGQQRRRQSTDEYSTRKVVPEDKIPKIYFCATMWHENEKEMVNMLKSVFRCDVDQCAKRIVKNKFEKQIIDYYEFEAHIFFDDAMEAHEEESEYKVNQFVKQFVNVINDAASQIHKQHNLILPPCTKYATPYGGRLEWIMPGGNLLTVHLKDKAKIRHKKRWSQVMYMYYFLGHRLWSSTEGGRKKQTKAENSFILALDGDTDFQPESVLLLLDIMKKDGNVGAACGRIHPIGNGPMVWYQKFEYSLGHWFQKATEHVLGCVLCSPGCFSLFRGAAIMDDNVMARYTTKPTEPEHYVQYDQGEDRWLCTLLLQAGWRIEYSAASDAYTYAPEDFKEFYNQRRRWGPSTLANILDLLSSAKRTTQNNDNMSYLYFFYQAAMFASALLGTATIFLMITESMIVAVNYGISPWVSLFINLIPLVIFSVICFTTKTDVQVKVAMILTVLYALLQMLVLVGIIINIGDEGACSPSALFFFSILAFFVVATLLHPQEAGTMVHGLLYFVFIPSMYMLLMIYSMCNINNVSWGTREIVPTKSELELQKEKELLAEAKKTKKSEKLTILQELRKMKEEGFTVGVGNIFRCILCPKPTVTQRDAETKLILEEIQVVKNSVVKLKETYSRLAGGEVEGIGRTRKGNLVKFAEQHEVMKFADDIIEEDQETKPVELRDGLINPYWIEDEGLGGGDVKELSKREVEFFDDLIFRYLEPLAQTKEEKEKMEQQLLDLRNKVAMSYFLLNAMFVTVIFTLQRNSDDIGVGWFCGDDSLEIEPIGFMIVAFFGLIMFAQFLGMLCHRMGTWLHIVAFSNERMSTKEREQQDVLTHFVKNMTRPKSEDRSSVVSQARSEVNPEGLDQDDYQIIHRKRSDLYQHERRQTPVEVAGNLEERVEQTMHGLAREGLWQKDNNNEEQRKILKNARVSRDRMSLAAINYLGKELKEIRKSSGQAPRWSVYSQPANFEQTNGHTVMNGNGNINQWSVNLGPQSPYERDDTSL